MSCPDTLLYPVTSYATQLVLLIPTFSCSSLLRHSFLIFIISLRHFCVNIFFDIFFML
nr:MAG TPA: hypothetical protein [Caudoviricetes sp.]